MGDLDDLFEPVSDLTDRDAFEAEVDAVRDAFHGLLDDRAAAMYVLARKDRLETQPEDAILPGREVTFDGVVERVHDVRTFQRQDGQGKVLNVEVARDGETVRLVFWDDDAERLRSLRPGEAVRVEDGFVKEGRYGIEVHLGRRGRLVREDRTPMPPDAEVGKAGPPNGGPTRDLAGILTDRSRTRTFHRDDGDVGFVTTVTVETDETRRDVTLWDETVREIQRVPLQRPVELTGLTERDGDLHSTDRTQIVAPGDGAVSLDAFSE